jgi:hypothetical protein
MSSHKTYVLFSTPSHALALYADLYNLVTWCHTKRSIGALFQQAFPLFLEPTGNVWWALNTYVMSHKMCATAEIWEACWHVSQTDLHARSRDVSRVTEVWICAIQFNVKSPLTSQLQALTSHELTWREDCVSPAWCKHINNTPSDTELHRN